jgi:hypothetical protein
LRRGAPLWSKTEVTTANEVSSFFNAGHEIRPSNVMEHAGQLLHRLRLKSSQTDL